MSYKLLVSQYIHPFVIYVVFGTLFSYVLGRIATRTLFGDSRSRALIYGVPFITPIIATIIHWQLNKCYVFGKPFGLVNDWLCNSGRAVAAILTPVFTVVLVLAVAKALLSLMATFRIKTKYGYATPANFPRLFSITGKLCGQGNTKIPRIIVTRDAFSRCFTMGYRAPVIVLSEGILTAMDDEELETVIAHELGHIVRADSLFTWFTVFIRDIMFFFPLVYWIFKDLAAEREKAADDIAVTLTQKPLAFAGALIKTWRLSPRSFVDTIMLDNFMPHPNLAGNAGILEFRVRRIIDGDQLLQRKANLGYAGVLIIFLFSALILSQFC